jgi:hypothetical protein
VCRLSAILKDPVAKDCFLQPTTTITDAFEKIRAPKWPRKNDLAGDIPAVTDSIRRRPWPALADLRGDEDAIRGIEEAEKLLKDT